MEFFGGDCLPLLEENGERGSDVTVQKGQDERERGNWKKAPSWFVSDGECREKGILWERCWSFSSFLAESKLIAGYKRCTVLKWCWILVNNHLPRYFVAINLPKCFDNVMIDKRGKGKRGRSGQTGGVSFTIVCGQYRRFPLLEITANDGRRTNVAAVPFFRVLSAAEVNWLILFFFSERNKKEKELIWKLLTQPKIVCLPRKNDKRQQRNRKCWGG